METDNLNHSQRKSKTLIILIIACFAFAFGYSVAKFNPALGFGSMNLGQASKVSNIDIAKLKEVESILIKKFDGDIDANKKTQGAIAGLVASLGDPYTTFLDKESVGELSSSLKGELSGVGIEVGIKNNRLTVIAPIEGTPAYKAGIRSGDVIALIDGTDSSTLTLDEAVNKIRGKKDTVVKLTIIRPGQDPKELEVKRDNITVESVVTEVKSDGVGVIKIRRFGDDTIEGTRAAAASLLKQDVKGVIIDLRDNAGGYLDGSVRVSSEFVDSGLIVEERSRHSSRAQKHEAIRGGLMTKIPLVVLINGGSASAAEIMSGALKDLGRATLVGEKSYGKGSVQELVDLDNGNAIKITVAHWYTPNGVNIAKEGIKPDIEVKNTPEDFNANRDPQMDKAIEVIKSKINS